MLVILKRNVSMRMSASQRSILQLLHNSFGHVREIIFKSTDTMQSHPTFDGLSWSKYWEAQGQPWRTECEIDAKRQAYLSERRAIKPDIEK